MILLYLWLPGIKILMLTLIYYGQHVFRIVRALIEKKQFFRITITEKLLLCLT